MNVEFDAKNRQLWEECLNRCFNNRIPVSAKYLKGEEMAGVLDQFCANDLNHLLLPTGGGIDVDSVRFVSAQILEFSHGRAFDQCRPVSLEFEHFPESPWNSFFLLTAGELPPTGAYEEPWESGREEAVDLGNGEYVQRSVWDEGYYCTDEFGRGIPLPAASRLVIRFYRGKFLFLAKTSLWNRDSKAYDARFSKMTAQEIRAIIQRALVPTRAT